MATMLDPNATEFRVTHIEMIKVGKVTSSSHQQIPAANQLIVSFVDGHTAGGCSGCQAAAHEL
jgi:hypothetical protein